MGGRILREYAAEHRSLGAAVFRKKHDEPVLVLEDATDVDDDRVFNTEVAAIDEVARGGGGVRAQQVFRIAKRAGGVFRDRIGVGRAPNADVCIPLRHVSKYHAYFTAAENGWTLTDAGSKNGTEVSGRPLDPKATARLEDGSEVRLGPYRFRFYGPDAFALLVARRAAVG